MGIWGGSKKGGGGTVDAEARALASALTSKMGNIYKVAGDSTKQGDEFFVVLADGSTVNFANYGKKALAIPNPATKDSMLAAGFSLLSGSTNAQDIINAIQTERTLWTVDGIVDFTKAEPANTAANHGKIYLSTVTGAGSISTKLTFDATDIYQLNNDGTWGEYKPKDGWIVSFQDRQFQFYNGAWKEKGGAHTHDRITDGQTTFVVSGGSINRITQV